MNQRNMNLIAKQGTVALHGPRRTQHIRCAFGPFVALSHVPVRLNAQKGGFTPPLYSRALSKFPSPDRSDFRRHFVFDPARILCAAGYFCCIGNTVLHRDQEVSPTGRGLFLLHWEFCLNAYFLSVVRYPVLSLCFGAMLLLRAFYCRLFQRGEHKTTTCSV